MSHSFSGLMGLGGGPIRHANRSMAASQDASVAYALAQDILNKARFTRDREQSCREAYEQVSTGDVAYGKAEAHIMEIERLGRERWMEKDAEGEGALEQAKYQFTGLRESAEETAELFRSVCLAQSETKTINITPKRKALGRMNGYRRR